MRPDNVEYLPIWKKDATPEERFLELAMMARKHPERFNKVAIVYQEELPSKRTVCRRASNNCSTTEFIGILQTAIVDVLTDER